MGGLGADWKFENNTLILNFDAPKDCQAVTVVLPKGKKYKLDSKKIRTDRTENNKAYFLLSSGKHTIAVSSPFLGD